MLNVICIRNLSFLISLFLVLLRNAPNNTKNLECYTLVLNAGCFDSAVRLRVGSLCSVLIMLIRHALHAFEKYGRDS